ncbi:Transcriptional regulator, XRE family [Weissella jogaejeotgali]|uniref:Transcriptional regulator, XRE family n=1 Tax=Weissella jogaejeotgali TaxID=1631871 RepID=A0A1L6R9R5_9LACO|nr:helix-turn-helix transcriptional regulator [Weissella jogaejeotgali]APS41287.1 Transcriptional regulator, XRE family [Weissella jogaejeotgali]
MRLKELRKTKGLTQTQVADELNMPQNTLSQYENENRKPSKLALKALADYYDVSIDYLVERGNQK